jgi:hypothetical protein
MSGTKALCDTHTSNICCLRLKAVIENRKKGHHITPKTKIYNGVLKNTSDNVCSAIYSLKKEKRMVPEDDPVRLKYVVNVF